MFDNFDVAPHGIVLFATIALLVILLAHVFGFRIVTALRFGK